MAQPFVMSIEEGNRTFVHGLHLGTHEPLARQLIEERFAARRSMGLETVTIALMHEGKVVDVYYGNAWHSATYAGEID